MNRMDTFRKCRSCGYRGYMDAWLSSYIYPKLLAFALFLFGGVPGVVFLVWSWNKLRCPSCGQVK